ncbi:MAG TPA: T9SS type A sorting domain-containing protein, partial [Cytophagaceae bacterium]
VAALFTFSCFAQIDYTDVTPNTTNNRHDFELTLSISKVFPGNLVLTQVNQVPTFNSDVSRYLSNNYGQSWRGGQTFNSTVDVAYGDPSTSIDANGTAYICAMKPWLDGYYIYRCNNTLDLNPVWTTFTGYQNGSTFDKQLIASDDNPYSQYKNNLYCVWSEDPGFKIRMNKSTNQYNANGTPNTSATFSTPITVSTQPGQGANVQVGPNGEVYIVWAEPALPESRLGFARSLNGGSSFEYINDNAVPITGVRGSFYNGARVQSFPSMAVDRGCALHSNNGRIYITCAEMVTENGISSDKIRVRHSDDKGTTWSSPVSVNILDANKSYHPWIAVDDATGDVFVVYCAIENASTFQASTYLAYSYDGGTNWSNIKVSDVSYTCNNATGEYEYIGVAAYGGKVVTGWIDNRTTSGVRSGLPTVYTSLTEFNSPSKYTSTSTIEINGPLNINNSPASVTYQAPIITAPNSSTLTLASGSNVVMNAKTYIQLNPGVLINLGSDYTAVLNPSLITSCTNTNHRDESEQISFEEVGFENVEKDIVTLYPNPSLDEVNFKLNESLKGVLQVSIFNEQGKTFHNGLRIINNDESSKNYRVDLRGFPNGTYFYSLKSDTFQKTGKFIKIQEGDLLQGPKKKAKVMIK